MLMRRRAFLVASLFCLMPLVGTFFCTTAVSATPFPQDSDFTMEGKITDKSAGKLTINSGDNIIFHVVYSQATEIKKKDGSAGTADDLHIGLKISVAGSLAESGEITAKRIEIIADEAETR
jgi:phage baseplate assembly protein gpV